MKILFI